MPKHVEVALQLGSNFEIFVRNTDIKGNSDTVSGASQDHLLGNNGKGVP